MSKYFDNDKIQKIVEHCIDSGDFSELEKITEDIDKLIMGIINTHKFTRFGVPIEDLKAEARVNIYEAIRRFDRSKGKLFNYLSLVAKNSLINYTRKISDYRNHFFGLMENVVDENDEEYVYEKKNIHDIHEKENEEINKDFVETLVNMLENRFGQKFVLDLLSYIKIHNVKDRESFNRIVKTYFSEEVLQEINRIIDIIDEQ